VYCSIYIDANGIVATAFSKPVSGDPFPDQTPVAQRFFRYNICRKPGHLEFENMNANTDVDLVGVGIM